VVNDKKLPIFETSPETKFTAEVLSYTDYYPFGYALPGRNASSDSYRYGFQGQEKDDEIKGEGKSYNYKYRMHDPRVGRFFAVDPLTAKYPHYTPYSFSGNKVIQFIELEGLEEAKTKIKKNVILFIEAENDILIDVWTKSKEMTHWHVIPGSDIFEVSRRFQEYTKGEKVVENLIIRTHGDRGGNIVLQGQGSEDALSVEEIKVNGVELRMFTHAEFGTFENLTKSRADGGEGWSPEKFSAIESLIQVGENTLSDAYICVSACDAGIQASTAIDYQRTLTGKRNVLFNLGKGGLSANYIKDIQVYGNPFNGRGYVFVDATYRLRKTPLSISTKATREKGFLLVSGDGEEKKVGEVIINDNENQPLEIKEKEEED
jgi:RHS repeat-associated protein